jgi:eukaryotic-like serine/threonine-protein kinase
MENPLDMPTPPPAEKPGPSSVAHPTDLTGQTLGEFQLIRRIGQGGMGQVYLARQLSLKRQVAVKILRTDLASNVTALQRFQHEAEAVARVTHANIVQVYAIGEANGLHYMALEYVEGRNLRDYLNRKGPPDIPIVLNIMRQVAAALQRASELGFVHRDIKPENILLTRKGEVKVADFGLSRCFADDKPLNITQSGVTMGTPLYMSPEQVQGRVVDPRSDVYSFGVTCYHMLAGEPPFRGQTPFEVALQHVQEVPKPLLEIRPDLPPELGAVVHKMMAKKPEDRYQTAREIIRDLTRLKEGLPTTATQALVGQSGAVAAARTEISGTAPVATFGPAPKWRRWALVVCSLLAAGTAGAAWHWRQAPVAQSKTTEAALPAFEALPSPAKAQEKDLLKRLHDSNIKSDVEVINALIDLGMLYVREKSNEEALHLFDAANLRNLPAVSAAQKQAPQLSAQYVNFLSALGKGIIFAYRDEPSKSNAEFGRVLGQPSVPAKVKGARQIEGFLWRYDHWKKLVADALDRNAKNLKVAKLEDPLNNYRYYSSKLP